MSKSRLTLCTFASLLVLAGCTAVAPGEEQVTPLPDAQTQTPSAENPDTDKTEDESQSELEAALESLNNTSEKLKDTSAGLDLGETTLEELNL